MYLLNGSTKNDKINRYTAPHVVPDITITDEQL